MLKSDAVTSGTILSRCDMKCFFDSVGALCTDCVKLAFFISGILRIAYCVFLFFFFLCLLPFAATLWQTIGGGPVSQSFSAFSVSRQALDGSVHRVTPSPDSALGKTWRWASLSVSLDCALICYTLVEIDSPESVL